MLLLQEATTPETRGTGLADLVTPTVVPAAKAPRTKTPSATATLFRTSESIEPETCPTILAAMMPLKMIRGVRYRSNSECIGIRESHKDDNAACACGK